jgi:hypothetical protein
MNILALVFIADIFMIFISKTGVLMTAALIALFVVHAEGWKRSLLIAAPIALVVAIALWSSAPAQRRLAEIATDIHAVDGDVSLWWRPPCGVSFKYGNCPYGQS